MGIDPQYVRLMGELAHTISYMREPVRVQDTLDVTLVKEKVQQYADTTAAWGKALL